MKQLDAVLTQLEQLFENADDSKLKEIAFGIEHISAHNAYRTGQIVFARKEQGSRDAGKGVK